MSSIFLFKSKCILLYALVATCLLNACIGHNKTSQENTKKDSIFAHNHESLSPLRLQNNITVVNCHDYREARITLRIDESYANQVRARKYLPCSLLTKPLPLDGDSLPAIYKHLLDVKMGDLLLSIRPRYSSKQTLREAGFVYQNISIRGINWQKDSQHISIQIMQKIDTSKYLVWVDDTIKETSYSSVYAGVLEIKANQEATISPFYTSGY